MPEATHAHTTPTPIARRTAAGPAGAPNPHQAPPVSAATRRDLFGTMGALLLLTPVEAGAAKATELDGELLACCAEWTEIEREDDRLWDAAVDLPVSHPAYNAWQDYISDTRPRWRALVKAISSLPCRTPEGLRAKAATARSAMPGDRVDDPEAADRLALSLFDDVLGRAGA